MTTDERRAIAQRLLEAEAELNLAQLEHDQLPTDETREALHLARVTLDLAEAVALAATFERPKNQALR